MEDEKEVIVTYTFNLYTNATELKSFQNVDKYEWALHKIHELCRTVWKYEENPSADRVKLAEQIGQIVFDSGAMEN